MCRWKSVAAAALTAALMTATSAAQAQRLSVPDAAGDTFEPGLDVTNVTFKNRDRAVITTWTFVRDRPGEVIFSVKARHRGYIGLVVSRHPRQGPDRLRLYTKASESLHDPAHCRGLLSEWDRPGARLEIRVPARCMVHGNYGAVRSWALIEAYHDGGDVDYAPQRPSGDFRVTDWIPRG